MEKRTCRYCKQDKPLNEYEIANTIKGKGCYIMENNPEWHHKVPTELEYNKILEML
jgi:hypothetical protein